ncbi:hypothetical protein C8R43DRAFT_966977 [Mycena crocata]|nr:hypothetical protein C8R43DRAFT_966977 [Mycena crocata]
MSTKQAALDPRLPTELEKEIFELVAENCFPGIPGLLLVAQRVKVWIEPMLYRTLIVAASELHGDIVDKPRRIISPEKFLEVLNSRPASFLHHHVRHLFLCQFAIDEAEKILTKCGGVQDIVFSGSTHPTFLPLLSAIAPRRLDMRLKDLFRPVAIDLSNMLFSRLTHLCVDSYDIDADNWQPWVGLATLPCLTHLAFFSVDSPEFLTNTLTRCPRLSMLVALWLKTSDVDEGLTEALVHDKRFLQLVVEDFLKDWQTGAFGGQDYWSRAEAIIRQRQ